MPVRVLFIFGTRPEAIKLCPVIQHMKSRQGEFAVRVCVTAQHREMLDQVLHAFDVTPDHDLDTMRPGQTLAQSTSRIIGALEPVLAEEEPDIVLVQGDTTTTFCGALTAFYANIRLAHIEAGLRTGDLHEPFPEEMNRVLTGRMAAFHFAATEGAAQNLYREGVEPATVTVTGNTGIDAVFRIKRSLDSGTLVGLRGFRTDASKKLIVVTAHRRESFGSGFDQICAALIRLAQRDDVEIVYPVHPNPSVRHIVVRCLAAQPNITLLDPLEYVAFVDLMCRAYLLLTDSGGVQEEAPSLGKPVLVLRDKTERHEAISTGTTRLVGTDQRRIIEAVESILDEPLVHDRMARRHDPYGDGKASERIAHVLARGATEHVGFGTRRPAQAEIGTAN